MQVDTDPLKVEEVFYSEINECMMIEATKGLNKDITADTFDCLMVETTEVLDNREKLETIYPQDGESLKDFPEKCRVSGSEATLCPRCNVVFNKKAAERLEEGRKKVVPTFVFDSRGNPRQNKEHQEQAQSTRPRMFVPPSDTPPENWVEEVSRKGSKRPKWRVMELGKEAESADKRAESKGYVVSLNYKGKNPMTRTQWRRYQHNKRVGKEASPSGTNPVEPTDQKRSIPQKKWVEKKKIMVNQTIAMIVDTAGKSEMVSNQSTKRSSTIKEPTIPE